MSNLYREWEGWVEALLPPGTVDVNCSSWLVGLRKPEPAIYRKLTAMLGTEPGEIAFVDDFPENIAAAEAEGLRGMLFVDEPQCRTALRALGVPVT